MKWNKAANISAFLSLVLVVVLFLSGSYILFSGVMGEDVSRHLRVTYVEPVLKKIDISYVFFNPLSSDLPVYDIAIKPKKYKKLLLSRENKTKDPYYKFPYVSAKFISEGKEYDVKVKLRGLLSNHWMGAKKSWRIKFPKEDLFNGKRKINLIIPADRDYLKESLAYYTAKKLGIVTPDSRFAVLRINGRVQGVYFVVEQMGKEYLAHNRIPEDAEIYDGEDSTLNDRTNIFRDLAFWSKIRGKKDEEFEDYSSINKLIEIMGFEDEKFYREIEGLVDIDKLLSWNANSMLYFDYHQDNTHNMRFLFSPITGLFEPLIWDCSHPVFKPEIDKMYNDLVTRILKKPLYLHMRNKILWDYIGSGKNLEEDLSFYDRTYKNTRTAFLGDRKKDISNLRFLYVIKNIRRDISSYYDHIKSMLEKSWVHAVIHYNTSQPGVVARIEASTGDFSAAKVVGFEVESSLENVEYKIYYDTNGDELFQGTDELLGKLRTADKGSYRSENLDFVLYPGRSEEGGFLLPVAEKYSFFITTSENLRPRYEKIKILASNDVTGKELEPVIKEVDDRVFVFFEEKFMSPEEFQSRYPFLGVRKTKEYGKFEIVSGEYKITETVIVPEMVSLRISGGSTFKFDPEVSFVSYGRIQADGEESHPIVFESNDPGRSWGVFAVVGSKAGGSVFDHIIVRNGSEATVNGIYFTGAFAAHDAEVEVSNSIFENNNGDDALNFKRRSSSVTDSTFRNNKMDAVDLDYIKDGVVSGCTFMDNGNDSIDIGNSTCKVVRSKILGSGDKGISVGEASEAVIFNSTVSECNIGVAVKDSSLVEMINCDIKGNKTGISLYRKKPLWQKSGTVKIYNSILDNDSDITLADNGEAILKDSIVADPSLANRKKGVFHKDFKNFKTLSADKDVVLEYFPDEKGERVTIGVF